MPLGIRSLRITLLKVCCNSLIYHSWIYLKSKIGKRRVFKSKSNIHNEAFFGLGSNYASGKCKEFWPINYLILIWVGFSGVHFAVCDGVCVCVCVCVCMCKGGCQVFFVKFSYLSKFHVNIITASGLRQFLFITVDQRS